MKNKLTLYVLLITFQFLAGCKPQVVAPPTEVGAAMKCRGAQCAPTPPIREIVRNGSQGDSSWNSVFHFSVDNPSGGDTLVMIRPEDLHRGTDYILEQLNTSYANRKGSLSRVQTASSSDVNCGITVNHAKTQISGAICERAGVPISQPRNLVGVTSYYSAKQGPGIIKSISAAYSTDPKYIPFTHIRLTIEADRGVTPKVYYSQELRKEGTIIGMKFDPISAYEAKLQRQVSTDNKRFYVDLAVGTGDDYLNVAINFSKETNPDNAHYRTQVLTPKHPKASESAEDIIQSNVSSR